jgi:hypothetical protein
MRTLALLLVSVITASGCSDADSLTCMPESRGRSSFAIQELVVDVSADGNTVLLAASPAGGTGGYYLAKGVRDSTPELIAAFLEKVPFLEPDDGVLSPDLTKVAWSRGSTGEIHIFDLVNHKERQVTSAGSEMGRYPSWSPDGRHIAYCRVFDEGGAGLRIVNVESLEDTLVLHNGERLGAAFSEWSPDGQWIAFSYGAPFDVYIVSVDGVQRKQVSPEIERSDWSPVSWIAEGPRIVIRGSSDLGRQCLSYEYDVMVEETMFLRVNLSVWEDLPSLISGNGEFFFYTDVGSSGKGVLYRDEVQSLGDHPIPVLAF